MRNDRKNGRDEKKNIAAAVEPLKLVKNHSREDWKLCSEVIGSIGFHFAKRNASFVR